MGLESFSRHAGIGRDKTIWGKGRRPHPSAPPHPIAIPTQRRWGGGDSSLEMERSLKQEGV